MKPTNAGVIPNVTAACCTDSTNTSLTSATSTVTPASVASATPSGNGASPASACSAPANNARCVLSENSRPSPYATMSSTDRHTLNVSVNVDPAPASAAVTAEGTRIATVAKNS